jgi:hypothetical protein
MRRKFTLGITVLSTSAITLSMSPAWMALSARTVLSTSTERRLISASGVSSAASAASGSPSA